jgi:hypothetical protein
MFAISDFAAGFPAVAGAPAAVKVHNDRIVY